YVRCLRVYSRWEQARGRESAMGLRSRTFSRPDERTVESPDDECRGAAGLGSWDLLPRSHGPRGRCRPCVGTSREVGLRGGWRLGAVDRRPRMGRTGRCAACALSTSIAMKIGTYPRGESRLAIEI